MDWRTEIIVRLLKIIDEYESRKTADSNDIVIDDDESFEDEVARLKAKIFGDPYPFDKKDKKGG